jgi:hypothetical protein
MRQGNFNINQFTSSVFVFLMNAIAETVEWGMTETEAESHIYEAFDKLAQTIENKEVDLADLANHDPFIKKYALELLILINDDASAYSQIKEKYDVIMAEAKKLYTNFSVMSKDSLENLGFAKWQDDHPIMLVPIWAYRLLPEDTTLLSINLDWGAKSASDSMVRVDRPIDIRFGHLAWGIQSFQKV